MQRSHRHPTHDHAQPPDAHLWPHQTGTRVTLRKPPLTHQYHVRPIVTSRVHMCVVHSMCLVKCTTRHTHPHTAENFPALQSLCSAYIPSVSPNPGDHWLIFQCLHGFDLSLTCHCIRYTVNCKGLRDAGATQWEDPGFPMNP